MSDLNNCAFVGRLTRDAEVKQVGNSTLVTFAIANNTGFGQYACTNFIEVNAWGKQAAGIVQYLVKGKQVAIAGTFENKRWTDQNGINHDKWTLTVNGAINMMADPKNAPRFAPSAPDDYGDPEGEPTF
jgi:single-strand DNA-binding protein